MATREHSLRVRLTELEFQRLDAYAKQVGLSKSEVIRDYVKSLKVKPEGK